MRDRQHVTDTLLLMQVEKALAESVANIHEKEPGTLRFYVLRPKKSNEFIVIEKCVLDPVERIGFEREQTASNQHRGLCRYQDMDALKVHGSTDYFKAMGAKVKPYLEAPTEVKFCNFVTGFEGRPSKL